VVTVDDVTKTKPDPMPYLTAAQKLGVAPGECIVIENAPLGVEAGVRAGCRVLGLLATSPLDADTCSKRARRLSIATRKSFANFWSRFWDRRHILVKNFRKRIGAMILIVQFGMFLWSSFLLLLAENRLDETYEKTSAYYLVAAFAVLCFSGPV
jgi:hypothetical protein